MKQFNHWIRWKIRRVDMQVSVFMAVIVLVSSFLIYKIGYTITYNNMIENLHDRVIAIHRYLEDEIDSATFFEINTQEDMQKPLYKITKHQLEKLRKVTDVMYLYTAKSNAAGDFVYIVDGLDQKDDFRYPGDKIEMEIYPDMQHALAGNVVLPQGIKETEWGKIFITYFPFHDESGNIIGVLGIEIAANSQYDTYYMLRMVTPISIVIFCLISVAFAVVFFRRISNPTYQDMLNTDQLTNLKNRNSFEVDINNMVSMGEKAALGLIVIDLDNLKKVNDIFGHDSGDQYIQQAAQAIRQSLNKEGVAYRTGGDEFAIIFADTELESMKAFAEQINLAFADLRTDISIPTSLSIGAALFDKVKDRDIRDTYRRADAAMYEQKKHRRIQYEA